MRRLSLFEPERETHYEQSLQMVRWSRPYKGQHTNYIWLLPVAPGRKSQALSSMTSNKGMDRTRRDKGA
jgi:hypothetical protein